MQKYRWSLILWQVLMKVYVLLSLNLSLSSCPIWPSQCYQYCAFAGKSLQLKICLRTFNIYLRGLCVSGQVWVERHARHRGNARVSLWEACCEHTHTHTLSYYFSPYTKPSEQSLKPAEEMGRVSLDKHICFRQMNLFLIGEYGWGLFVGRWID